MSDLQIHPVATPENARLNARPQESNARVVLEGAACVSITA